VDAEGLWQFAQISDREGFNFHNSLIELLVHWGWIGASLVLLVFLTACLALLRRNVRAPTLAGGFFISFVVFEMARSPFESLGPAPVDFGALLLIAALGYGLGKVSPDPDRHARRRPAPWRAAAAPDRRYRWGYRWAAADDPGGAPRLRSGK